MSTKKKAAGLSALKNLSPSEATQEEAPKTAPRGRAKTTPVPKPKPAAKTKSSLSPDAAPSVKQEKVAFSLNLPEEAHTKLRELSFHERQSMTQLILEGVDMLFESRGLPSIAKSDSKRSKTDIYR